MAENTFFTPVDMRNGQFTSPEKAIKRDNLPINDPYVKPPQDVIYPTNPFSDAFAIQQDITTTSHTRSILGVSSLAGQGRTPDQATVPKAPIANKVKSLATPQVTPTNDSLIPPDMNYWKPPRPCPAFALDTNIKLKQLYWEEEVLVKKLAKRQRDTRQLFWSLRDGFWFNKPVDRYKKEQHINSVIRSHLRGVRREFGLL